mmetsp:Transcript_8685/g.16455  ORF Transcript_8685/g.16455 Transcript_8685/m.16455 type:complete len:223 (+) Transcript_8685:635-1303(+)
MASLDSSNWQRRFFAASARALRFSRASNSAARAPSSRSECSSWRASSRIFCFNSACSLDMYAFATRVLDAARERSFRSSDAATWRSLSRFFLASSALASSKRAFAMSDCAATLVSWRASCVSSLARSSATATMTCAVSSSSCLAAAAIRLATSSSALASRCSAEAFAWACRSSRLAIDCSACLRQSPKRLRAAWSSASARLASVVAQRRWSPHVRAVACRPL